MKSVTPANTSCRPCREKISPSTNTSPDPLSGSTISSWSPVLNASPSCTMRSPVNSSIGGLLELRFDFFDGRHRVGAGQPPGDDRARRVAEAHHPLEVPLREQAVAQRAAERVARAQSVDDLDRRGRHLDGLAAARG